jgi:hypothetical protein
MSGIAAHSSAAPWFPLRRGRHHSRADGVCLTEAVAWMAGEPHTDRPASLCPVLGAWGRAWNDRLPNDETRTRLLGPLVPQLVSSRSSAEIEKRRSILAFDWLIRSYTAAWLECRLELRDHAADLRALGEIASDRDLPNVQRILSRARDRASVSWDDERLRRRDAAEGRHQTARAWLQGTYAAAWDAASASGWDAARDAADRPRWAEARAAAWHSAWTVECAFALSGTWASAIAGAAEQQDATACATAYAAATAALAPVVASLQESASRLCLRMIATRGS